MTDSSYLINDWFVNENAVFTVRYYFSAMIANMSSAVDIEVIYFSVYLLAFFATAIGVFLISKHLFNNNLTGFLAIFLLFFGSTASLGGNWVFYSTLMPAHLANTFAVFAIYFFLKKREYVSFLLLGMASIFQVLIGLLVAGMLLFHLLLSLRIKKERKNTLVKIIISSIVYCLLASVNIIPTLSTLSSDTSSSVIFETLGHIRHPWHYMPFQFSIMSYITFLSVIALFLVTLAQEKPNKKDHEIVKSVIIATILICLVGTIFVELVPVTAVLKLQAFKTTTFLMLFVYIYLGNFLRLILTEKVNVFKTLKDFKKVREYQVSALLLIIVAVGFLLTLTSGSYGILPEGVYGFFKNMLLLSTIAIFVFLIAVRTVFEKFVNMDRHTILVLVCILLIAVFGATSYFIATLVSATNSPYDAERIDIYSCIKENTEADSIFITPPYFSDFRLGANRATIVDFKSFPFADKSIIGWRERIRDVTNDAEFIFRGARSDEIRNGFLTLSDEDAIRISEKYNAAYIFSEKEHVFNFDIICENSKYNVYKIQSS